MVLYHSMSSSTVSWEDNWNSIKASYEPDSEDEEEINETDFIRPEITLAFTVEDLLNLINQYDSPNPRR